MTGATAAYLEPWCPCCDNSESRFSPQIDLIFFGEALNPFLVLKMKDFRNIVLDNCILDFDAEQVY